MKSRQFKTGSREFFSRTRIGALTALLVCAEVHAQQALTNAAPQINTVTAPVKTVVGPPDLDAKRLFALGMIETGNDDSEVGAAGEVSRYQIHPTVWKAYSQRMDYRNTAVAIEVARQHWAWLAGYFVEKAGRQPNDFDMYVLWNTKFGYYARRGFSPGRLAARVQDRAQRFVNLVNRKG